MEQVIQGSSSQELDNIIQEFFNPGETVSLDIFTDRDLTQEQLAEYGNYLANGGLSVSSVSSRGNGVVSVQFERPARHSGYAQWQIALLLLGGLGLVAGSAVFGWQIGSGLKSFLESLGKALVPMCLIIGGVLVLTTFTKSKYAAGG